MQALIDAWEQSEFAMYRYPRSKWLGFMEAILRQHYPQASSDELTLTARNLAPFPLAKPGVP